jgi:transcriptional regulator with XRE-family HTH domain
VRKRLDETVSWEIKPRLVEILVAGIHVAIELHGVKQANIAVTYRFAEPSQPLPLMLPQSYSNGKVIRIPVEPKTIGDHIRKRRLELKLLQKDVAIKLGVCQPCVYRWESNRSSVSSPKACKNLQATCTASVRLSTKRSTCGTKWMLRPALNTRSIAKGSHTEASGWFPVAGLRRARNPLICFIRGIVQW